MIIIDNLNKSILTTLGARNYALEEREKDDFYATEPKAVEMLLEKEKFNSNILEPACGMGHIANVLLQHKYDVTSFDIVDRGYGNVADFFNIDVWNGDIVTNPPYKEALKFVQHAIDIVQNGAKVAMFLRLLFLESKARGEFFQKYPPKIVYVSSKRLTCAKNGDFERYRHSNAQAYAWFVWEKGYSGKTVVDWINL